MKRWIAREARRLADRLDPKPKAKSDVGSLTLNLEVTGVNELDAKLAEGLIASVDRAGVSAKKLPPKRRARR